MKRNLLIAILTVVHFGAFGQVLLKDSFYFLTPVEVKAIRAGENAPFTKTNISKATIKKNNLGQDIPFLLNQTPSVVINSDAGNGIGYTGIRIRGTDATRVNITLNGIPSNDAESQGVFFVNLPDFASSAGSIQIQRGVGTSSNGAGAFGGTINISTNEINKEALVELNNTIGSFQTLKNTLKASTGERNGLSSEVRISRITSNGFIDRASSRLHALYFTTAYTGNKTSLRLNVFTGKEKTYQAWYGISEADLKADNRRVNYAGTEKPDAPYPNETDNYTQTHYQFFVSQHLTKQLQLTTALFLTRGKGYYEQYKAAEEYSKYGMPNAYSTTGLVTETDLVRQLWLDNYFYGNTFSLQYKKNKVLATLGGAYTRYEGNHYGKVVWADKGLTTNKKWYDLDADKNDFNIYLKQQTTVAKHLHLFYDMQYRHVIYSMEGFRNNPTLAVQNRYHFFNPKAGISYVKNGWKTYLSFGVANKEPNRDDFEAGASTRPLPEKLYNVEYGIEQKKANYNWAATIFFMDYKNQLVLTGKINDVGAYTRTNIAKSYRAGVELEGTYQLSTKWNAAANIALSQNKVKDFIEYIDDYDNGLQQTIPYTRTDIAYSPNLIGALTINYVPVKKLELSFMNKYVGKQYLDNTSNDSRSLNSFTIQDVKISYTLGYKWLKEVNLIGQVNNVFNTKYEPNGYTFSYIAGGHTTTENFYFPMAGINFMLGINVRM